jgi:hypothetical protein
VRAAHTQSHIHIHIHTDNTTTCWHTQQRGTHPHTRDVLVSAAGARPEKALPHMSRYVSAVSADMDAGSVPLSWLRPITSRLPAYSDAAVTERDKSHTRQPRLTSAP